MCSLRCMIQFIIIVTLIIFIGYSFKYLREPFENRLYLSGPTKCFSCERDMIRRLGPEYAWMGKQSKCFDCEAQLARIDPNLANYTHGTKCFDCESQLEDSNMNLTNYIHNP
jgi:hypothetical protein